MYVVSVPLAFCRCFVNITYVFGYSLLVFGTLLMLCYYIVNVPLVLRSYLLILHSYVVHVSAVCRQYVVSVWLTW